MNRLILSFPQWVQSLSLSFTIWAGHTENIVLGDYGQTQLGVSAVESEPKHEPGEKAVFISLHFDVLT